MKMIDLACFEVTETIAYEEADVVCVKAQCVIVSISHSAPGFKCYQSNGTHFTGLIENSSPQRIRILIPENRTSDTFMLAEVKTRNVFLTKRCSHLCFLHVYSVCTVCELECTGCIMPMIVNLKTR